MNNEIGKSYVAWCRFRLMNQYWPRVQRCVNELPDEDIWWRAHESNNSVGNLILHLTGNLNQFVLSAIGGADDTREKPREFAERTPIAKQELLRNLSAALEQSDRVLEQFDASRLLELTTVQGRSRPIFEVLSIVLEHFALHTGQIIYITKLRTGKELRF